MSAIAEVALACWVVLELGVRVREALGGRGGRDRDRGTRVLIVLAIAAAILTASITMSRVPSLRIPAAGRAAGVAVLWLGLAVRAWAIATLGRAFRTTVEVDPGQAVVTSGPYRWVRHPSYTGLLMLVAGYGLAAGTWVGLAACLVLPPAAVVRRIAVEEAELDRVLGEPYRAYRARTARLVPRLW
jgi:protein-S-isoprenylcysteine O-methyltransferase Ste14